MSSVQLLGLVMGAAFASGLNLYATVAALGLLHRFAVIHLPPQLDLLAHPVVLGVAITLYAIEFVADKVPYADNVWDVIHTFIRPPAAAVLAYAAFGAVPEAWRLSAALLAGTVALTSHGAKATTRTAVNTSPEPVSNWLLSLGEDGIAVTLAWLAVTHPLIALAVVLLLVAVSLYIIVKLLGVMRRLLLRVFRRAPEPSTHGPQA